jgi:hypothetical protein
MVQVPHSFDLVMGFAKGFPLSPYLFLLVVMALVVLLLKRLDFINFKVFKWGDLRN